MAETVLTKDDFVGIIQWPHTKWTYEDLPKYVRGVLEAASESGKTTLVIATGYNRQNALNLRHSVIFRFGCVAVLRPFSSELEIHKDRTGRLRTGTVLLSPGLYMQALRLAQKVDELGPPTKP